MGHKTFTIALVLGLTWIPLACSGDDDDDTNPTGGTSGEAGEGGTAGKGGSAAAGKGGSATAGKAGSAGAGGDGGTGNVGGGEAGGGAGGQAGGGADAGGEGGGGQGGGGQGGGGAGEGGSGGDPAAEARKVKCDAICARDAGDPAVQCTGDVADCSAGLCDATGFDATCIEALEAVLTCLEGAPAADFYCQEPTAPAANQVGWDFAADVSCPADVAVLGPCRNN